MTIAQRLANQRALRSRKYARRLVNDDRYMSDFKLRAGIYGREWADMIWQLCRSIKRGEI